MIRGRTGDEGELEFFDNSAPGTVVGAVTKDGITGAAAGDVTAADITDATTVGRSVLTAADAAAARTAIGAGTSSLALGATGTTAAAGNHVHTATQVTATAVSPGTATTVQGILAELAARIAALEAA